MNAQKIMEDVLKTASIREVALRVDVTVAINWQEMDILATV